MNVVLSEKAIRQILDLSYMGPVSTRGKIDGGLFWHSENSNPLNQINLGTLQCQKASLLRRKVAPQRNKQKYREKNVRAFYNIVREHALW